MSVGSGRVPGEAAGRFRSDVRSASSRAHHAVAVLGLETRERFDVGEERVALARELQDFLFEAAPFGLAAAPGVGLRVGDDPPRLDLRVVEHLTRLGGGLADRFVGRALREQQGAVEDVLGLARVTGLGLRGAEALASSVASARSRPRASRPHVRAARSHRHGCSRGSSHESRRHEARVV